VRKRTTTVAGAALALALIVAGCGGTKQNPPPTTTTVALERHCVDLWNADGNRYVRKLLRVVGTPLRNVTVGLAGGPGHTVRCLITASNPDTGKAAQFYESNEPTTYRGSTVRGYFRLSGDDTQLSGDLEESATEWNASADESGAITVNDR
jgi:hypothetical protein